LFERGGKTFCDSLQVAETFEKRHDNVLMTLEGETRDGVHKNGLLDELAQSPVFTGDYFIKDSHKDARGRRQPRYLMSRDGFTLLVMGFTGEKALRFKLDYINRFNQMEAFIQSLLTTKLEFPAFTEAIMLSQWNFA
jgi:Rha family phage regulatory protein